jgi:hypothetical protein
LGGPQLEHILHNVGVTECQIGSVDVVVPHVMVKLIALRVASGLAIKFLCTVC